MMQMHNWPSNEIIISGLFCQELVGFLHKWDSPNGESKYDPIDSISIHCRWKLSTCVVMDTQAQRSALLYPFMSQSFCFQLSLNIWEDLCNRGSHLGHSCWMHQGNSWSSLHEIACRKNPFMPFNKEPVEKFTALMSSEQQTKKITSAAVF